MNLICEVVGIAIMMLLEGRYTLTSFFIDLLGFNVLMLWSITLRS